MTTILKLEKEDINTSLIGVNIQIVINENIQIVFSREALDELITDYEVIKKQDGCQHVFILPTIITDENSLITCEECGEIRKIEKTE